MGINFENISIRIKFILLAIVISIVSVVTTVIILGVSNARQHNKNLQKIIESDAKCIAFNSSPCIRNNNADSIQIVLLNLRTRLKYQTIAIIDTNHTIIGLATTEEDPVLSPIYDTVPVLRVHSGILKYNYPVMSANKLIGYVYFQVNTEMRAVIRKLVIPVIVVIVSAVIISLLIALRFRKFITEPILHLAGMASNVSTNKDFSIKIDKKSNDEIGRLYDNFNFMLETIIRHEKKRDAAELAYQIIEENFMNIFHNSYDGILLTDMQGGFLEVNDTLCGYIGCTREEFKKKGILGFVTPEYLDRRDKIMDDLRYKGFSSHDITLVVDDGTEVPFDVNSRLIYYENQDAILSILRDGRERKEHEDRLKYEANVNRAIAQISREIINPELSLENISHTVNLLAQKLTNSSLGYTSYFDPYTDDKVVSTTDKKVDWDNTGQTIIRFPKTKKGYSCLYRAVHNDDKACFNNNPMLEKYNLGKGISSITIENYLSVPAKSGNKIIGQIVLANRPEGYDSEALEIISRIADIYSVAVHQKLTNEDLKREMHRAEESDRLKSAFLANMSHEIRTPMNGILGFTTLLRNESLTDNARDKYLNIISNSSERLLGILNDIIDISKIESGIINLSPSLFSLNLLLDEVYSLFKPTAKKKGIKLNLSRQAGLDIMLDTDRQKVLQIITNLISNAIKFTLNGGVEITYSVDNKLNRVTINVKDTGIGIADEYKDKIFQRFRQVETSITRQFGGNGLGLSISKAYASAMDGDLTFTSKVGEGTTFSLEIGYKSSQKELMDNPELYKEIENVSFLGTYILFIDNDETNYEYIHKVLEAIDVKLIWTNSGIDALNKIKEQNIPPGMLVIGVNEVNNNDIIAIKKLKNKIPALPLVSHGQNTITGKNTIRTSLDFSNNLPKPINFKQFIQVIKKHLENR